MAENQPADVTLVAIAKDEKRFILDWLGYHLGIGFDRIRVYSNESTDGMDDMLQRIAEADPRVSWTPWPSRTGVSPQVSAYEDGVRVATTEWVGFIDMDEYFNPFGFDDAKAFFSSLPEDVSSVHLNWRNFGSGGLTRPDYTSVRHAFKRCAPRIWGNHHHFKSFGRRTRVESVAVHDFQAAYGRRVLSDLGDFETRNRGLSDRIAHDGVQINHYQSKTFTEFQARMRRGSANWPAGAMGKFKDDSIERFSRLDRNEELDETIGRFDAAAAAEVARLEAVLANARARPAGTVAGGTAGAGGVALEIPMSKPEQDLFKAALKNCDRYVEFGMSGATALAAEMARRSVTAVTSEGDLYEKVQAAIHQPEKQVRLTLADVGPTGKWGFPNQKDPVLFLNYHQNQAASLAEGFDLCLIDGRFRVACFALAARHMASDAIIAFHDYRSRPHFHVAELIGKPIAEVGDLTLFTRRSGTSPDDCDALFERFKLDPR